MNRVKQSFWKSQLLDTPGYKNYLAEEEEEKNHRAADFEPSTVHPQLISTISKEAALIFYRSLDTQ